MALSNHLRIDDLIAGAMSGFQPNELAYLVLTGNSEGPMRDRIAFHLHGHSTVVGNAWHVSREYDRVDLVLLQESNVRPHTAVEFKAHHGFDGILKSKRQPMIKGIRDDVAKLGRMRKKWGAGAEGHAVLALVQPQAAPPTALVDLIAYASEARRAIDDCGSPEKVRELSRAFCLEALEDLKPRLLTEPTKAGTAFHVPVEVDWFIIGPF
jgi:hypothetical protein